MWPEQPPEGWVGGWGTQPNGRAGMGSGSGKGVWCGQDQGQGQQGHLPVESADSAGEKQGSSGPEFCTANKEGARAGVIPDAWGRSEEGQGRTNQGHKALTHSARVGRGKGERREEQKRGKTPQHQG